MEDKKNMKDDAKIVQTEDKFILKRLLVNSYRFILPGY